MDILRKIIRSAFEKYRYLIFNIRNYFNNRLYDSRIKEEVKEVNDTRQSWEDCFIFLLKPILNQMSKGKARVYIKSIQTNIAGKHSDSLEGFSRTMLGVGFYLYNKKDSKINLNNKKIDIASIYRKGLINGTNSKHAEYWGKIFDCRRIVENGFIAIAILLNPKIFLEKLSEVERANLKEWFKRNSKIEVGMNNWQWSKLFHYLLLEKLENKNYETEIENHIEMIECMYQKDGWYCDGIDAMESRYDYYSIWSMQFYPLLFCLIADKKYSKWKKIYKSRMKRFIRDYQYFLTPFNHSPIFGRSQTYKFATLAPIGLSAVLGCCDANMKWLKASANSTVNIFLKKGLTKEGNFCLGLYHNFRPMLEEYTGSCSSYWSFEGFSLLLLPDNHLFWKINTAGMKPKKLIHLIPTIKSMLIHTGDSNIIFINGISHFPDYIEKYNKFAYSNTFIMNYSKESPDNTLLLSKDKKKWHQRGRIINSYSNNNSVHLKWIPEGINDTFVKTLITAKTKGYKISHKVHSKYLLFFKVGGFPIAEELNIEKPIIEGNRIVIGGKQGISGIKLISGNAKPSICRFVNASPVAKYSFVPYFYGETDGPTNILSLDLWTENPVFKAKNQK